MPLPEPIIQSLRSAMAERRLVAYHKWGDDPTIFLVGFIEEVKSDRILFDQVGTQGEPENEIDVVDMESIQQLDFDSDYLRGLEMLFAVHDELIGKKPSAGIRATCHTDIVKNLQSAKNSGEAVLIELDDEKRSCLVQDISGEFACFKQIRDGGYVDGVFWIKMSLIQVLKRKTDQQIADRFLCENR